MEGPRAFPEANFELAPRMLPWPWLWCLAAAGSSDWVSPINGGIAAATLEASTLFDEGPRRITPPAARQVWTSLPEP